MNAVLGITNAFLPCVIATSSIADSPSASPVSAQVGASNGTKLFKAAGALNGQSASFFELFQQSASDAAVETPIPASGKSTGVFKTDGTASWQSTGLIELLQQSAASVTVEQPTASTSTSKKDGKQKKSGSDALDLDVQAPAVPGDNLTRWLPFTSPAVVDNQTFTAPVAVDNAAGLAPAEPSSLTLMPAPSEPVARTSQSGAVFASAMASGAAAGQDEFRVDWKTGRDTGSSANLAFALKLKPLASAVTPAPDASIGAAVPATPLTTASAAVSMPASALPIGVALPVAEAPIAPSLPPVQDRGAKSGEISVGAPPVPTDAKSGSQSAPDPRSGSEDSSQGKHTLATKTALAGQQEKARPESTDAPASVIGARVHAQAQDSTVPVTQATTIPAVPSGTVAPKDVTPPAPTPGVMREDAPATTRPAQEISLQVSGADDRKVEVHLVERAGEVHVSVRTPDVGLAHELRQDLGSLTGKLAQSGYGTEQAAPLSAGSSNLADQRGAGDRQDSSRGQGQDPRQGGSGQQQQHQDERGKRPAWTEEVENILAKRQTNRSTT